MNEMKGARPFLSICIPTYNGASSSLDLVLEEAIRIANHYKDVEIIVSDNCSTDATRDLALSYKNRCPRLRYSRNEENLGFNGNMLSLAELARGEFIWMTGDDDVINYSTFDSLYAALRSNTIDYISVRFSFAYKEDYSAPVETSESISLAKCSFAEVLQNNCFRGNTLATFMGSSIARLSMFQSVDTSMIENKFDNFYNCFPNAYIVATAFHNARCAYVSEPCITCVSPKNRKKTYENISSWATIDTNAIVGLFEYVCSLGIKRKDLRRTEERIVFDYIVTGAKMKAKGMGLPPRYLHYLCKAITFPKVLGSLALKVSNGLFKTDFPVNI